MVEHYQIAIIGGGPAGLAAAIEAGTAGAKTLLIDENARPGGQLFKQIHKFFGSRAHNAGIRGFDIGTSLLRDTEQAGVSVWLNSVVVGIFEENHLYVVHDCGGKKEMRAIQAEKILVAAGGQESPIMFEGWTLPGVMGAGCAQTMINVNRVLPGKNVIMIGSGNVGLIVSYQLMQAGANVVGIVEAANNIGGYGVHAAKIKRAGVEFYLGHTIVRAVADLEVVSRAVIGKLDHNKKIIPGRELSFEVDMICFAVGLTPSAKLTQLQGARQVFMPAMGGWMPMHDKNMETSIAGLYVAGDAAGVEEANTAMDEGRLAGIAMVQSLGLMKNDVAEEKKAEIRGRLRSLRLGPFGERRLRAKESIMRGERDE